MKSLAICLLAAAVALPAVAAPVAYRIDFTIPSEAPVSAPTGSFFYDPALGFSNFLVQWESATFDMTSAANAPTVASDPASGCDGAASPHQYGFAIVTQSATNCAAQYGWGGVYDGPSGIALLNLALLVGNAQDGFTALAFFTGQPGTPASMGFGSWTVTEAPEPGTLGMLMAGGLALALALCRIARHRAA